MVLFMECEQPNCLLEKKNIIKLLFLGGNIIYKYLLTVPYGRLFSTYLKVFYDSLISLQNTVILTLLKYLYF